MIAGIYEPKDTLDEKLNRITERAEQVRLMWVQHDPARTSLRDAPRPYQG